MGERREKILGVRKRVGMVTKYSSNNYPQVPAIYDIDMTELLKLKEYYAEQGVKVSMSAVIAKVIAKALEEHPRVNSRIEGDEIVYYDEFNCGFAIDVGTGLMIVVVKDLAAKSIPEISDEFRALVHKCKDKKLTMDDISGGTFTLTTFSDSAMREFLSIITNDEAIMIGTAGIYKRPVVDKEGNIVARDMCTFTANMNHLILDGLENARFLGTVKTIAENPRQYLSV